MRIRAYAVRFWRLGGSQCLRIRVQGLGLMIKLASLFGDVSRIRNTFSWMREMKTCSLMGFTGREPSKEISKV